MRILGENRSAALSRAGMDRISSESSRQRKTLANCAMNLIFMINHFKLLYAHFKS